MGRLNFDDDFFFKLDKEELATIFYGAKKYADTILSTDAIKGLPAEDAKTMALSLAVTAELLRRYNKATVE